MLTQFIGQFCLLLSQTLDDGIKKEVLLTGMMWGFVCDKWMGIEVGVRGMDWVFAGEIDGCRGLSWRMDRVVEDFAFGLRRERGHWFLCACLV